MNSGSLAHPLRPRTTGVPFARRLASHGDRVALVTADGEMSYGELDGRAAAVARRLGTERRLVLVTGGNTVGALAGYLGALAGGHPVLLVPDGHPGALRSVTETYDPDVVLRPLPDGSGCTVEERRAVSAHVLHPDLALLLSTSGSTGSPKLVRLSHENLQANAESIARYLAIREGDRTATTLPMHYCYGLSVVHSHLASGAALILTELSVADEEFWDLFRSARGTGLAGVPYTFDLLDRVGFPDMELPHLRYLTQAGGRLAPERVARYAELARRDGWELFVMYGQTEATARMAYLPPGLAASRPGAIGVPVPGGSFRLAPLPDGERAGEGTGELVYSGPNVMLGYADGPADLAQGRTVHELHTGDVARRARDGLYEIVGRRSRFVKILGLRIDPQRVEAALEGHGVGAYCVGDDRELIVAVAEGSPAAAELRRLVTDACGLPGHLVRVAVLPELPRLATGKPDYQAVREWARHSHAAGTPSRGTGTADLCRLYAELLGRPEATENDTFVGLGGDSLSYVEMSLRLEEALGRLPDGWPTRPIRDLAGPPTAPRPAEATGRAAGPQRLRRRWRGHTLETTVFLRAVAIVLIAGSHIHLFKIQGGAHVLLGVAGYNFARFHLTSAGRGARIRKAWRSVARIAVPSALLILLAFLTTDKYSLVNVVLLNDILGGTDTRIHFWFVEALVYFLVAVTALLAIPRLDAAERRHPFVLPMVLMAAGLITRYDLPGLDLDVHHLRAVNVFWLFALGWAAAKAHGNRQRALVTMALVVTVPGFMDQPGREAVILAGLFLLIWLPTLPSLRPLNRLAGMLAGASLYIYLSHWSVFPHIEEHSKLLALAASLVVGFLCGEVIGRLLRRLRI